MTCAPPGGDVCRTLASISGPRRHACREDSRRACRGRRRARHSAKRSKIRKFVVTILAELLTRHVVSFTLIPSVFLAVPSAPASGIPGPILLTS